MALVSVIGRGNCLGPGEIFLCFSLFSGHFGLWEALLENYRSANGSVTPSISDAL